MKRNALILCAVATFCSTMIACKKDTSNDGSSTAVDGNWNFVSLTADTKVTVTAAGETVTSISHYVSTKASGSITMLNGKYSTDGMSYTAVGSLSSTDSENAADPINIPLNFDVPGVKSAGTYKVTGDSLYSSGTFVKLNDAGNPGIETNTSGGKFTIFNDTLTLTSTLSTSKEVVQNGITGKSSYLGTTVTKLVRIK